MARPRIVDRKQVGIHSIARHVYIALGKPHFYMLYHKSTIHTKQYTQIQILRHVTTKQFRKFKQFYLNTPVYKEE